MHNKSTNLTRRKRVLKRWAAHWQEGYFTDANTLIEAKNSPYQTMKL